MRTLSPETRQIELDVSDVDRDAFTLSELDADGVWIDEIAVFGDNDEALKAAEKLARETGLPLVFRTVHPAFG